MRISKISVSENDRLTGQKKPKNTPNYKKLDAYLDGKNFDENYALISHYIQLQSSDESKKYKKILTDNGIDISKLPTAEKFNKENDVPFPCKKDPTFTFIDLFAGIGGFRLAMQDIGGKCVFSSEWDDAAKQTYFENYGEVPFGDITKEETKELIPEHFDILCGGFPCQPFSYSGQKKGFNDPTKGTLFFDICEILRKYKPDAFFLENVKGLVSHDNGKTIETIRYKLHDELNYDIHEKILCSLDFGLPQKR